MLKTILQKMVTGDVHSRADMAQQLDISEDLLERMLEDLARKGYLTPLSEEASYSCAGSCTGCKSVCAGCGAHQTTLPQGWMLTAKGLKAAR